MKVFYNLSPSSHEGVPQKSQRNKLVCVLSNRYCISKYSMRFMFYLLLIGAIYFGICIGIMSNVTDLSINV